jgi:hypothetical protein
VLRMERVGESGPYSTAPDNDNAHVYFISGAHRLRPLDYEPMARVDQAAMSPVFIE